MVDIPIPESAAAELPRAEVDEGFLAKLLRCDDSAIRRYARTGILRRTSKGRYPLYESVGSVVEHLRQVASGHGSADAMRAGAALKEAQRRLLELKFQQLDGQLLSMPEIEAVWGDLVASAKWLFLAFPARAKAAVPELTDAQVAGLGEICRLMLSEVAIQGEKPQLPAAKTILDADTEADD